MQMGRRRRFFYKFSILQKNRLFFAVAWQRRRIGLEAAAAVEAVGAEAAFGQADGLDELLEFVEAQGGEAQAAAYLLDEALILG